jgi:hypothetical protein
MCEKPPKELSDAVSKSPSKPNSKGENRSAFDTRRTAAIWNHSVSVGLLEASFEICELFAFLALAASANSMLINTWVENRYSTKTTLEDLAALRHKEMTPLDPKEQVIEDTGAVGASIVSTSAKR